MKFKVSIFLLALLLVCSSCFIALEKPDIEQASYDDLIAVDEIGPVLAEKIIQYIEVNGNIEVDELKSIKGIGPERIKNLKKEFR